MLKNSTDSSTEAVHDVAGFIRHARDRNMSHEMIRHLLLSGGWKDKEICNQLALIELNWPIPLAREKGGAREAFFYLTAFTCLYVSAVAFIIMVFNLIEVTIPDATDDFWTAEWAYSTIRSTLSTVVVFFPLYLVFTWLIHRDTKRGKIVAGGAVERWLTYLTLFVIGMTVLIDAASLLYWLLEGEVTIRLVCKAFVLFVVMCGIFAYLWRGSMRWAGKTKTQEVSGQE